MNLDIAAVVHEGRRRVRAVRRWRLIALALLALLVIGAQVFGGLLLRPPVRLYVYTGGDWRETTLPNGEIPAQAVVMDDGTLWVHTRSECGFLRYDGSAWSDCQGGTDVQFGQLFNSPLSATHDDQVWSINNTSVSHFDGDNWTVYRNVLPTYSPSDIEASALGAFVVDYYGNIASFDGSQWTVQPVSALLPNVSGGIYNNIANLTKDADGAIYLLYGATIYRYDGLRWRVFHRATNATMINQLFLVQDDSLWVYAAPDGVGALNLSGSRRFEARDTGLNGEYPTQFVMAGSTPTLVTYRGVYQWDGGQWTIMPAQPSPTNPYEQLLTASAGGALWATVYDQPYFDPYASLRREVGLFLRDGWWIIGVGGLLLLTLLRPGAATRAHMTARRVWAARFDVPDLVTVQAGGGLYRFSLLFFFMLLNIAIFAYAWGEARGGDGFKLLAGLLVLIGVVHPAVMRLGGYRPVRRSLHVEDHALRRAYVLVAALVIGAALYFPAALVWERTGLHGFFGIATCVLLTFFLAWVALNSLIGVALRRTERVMRTGDDTAVERQFKRIERWLPAQVRVQLLRADYAHQRGDLAQAAHGYRRSLYELQADPRWAAYTLRQLAAVYTRQNCPDHALPLLECAVEVLPESAAGYRDLAAHLQERDPQRAQSLLAAAHTFH